MILIDVNLLIYAVNEDAPFNGEAKIWLERSLSGPETVAFSWNVLLAFLRLTTRSGVFATPLAVEAAFELVQDWLNRPQVVVLEPGHQHLRLLRELLAPLGSGGNLTSDAHLAAIAIEHGAELCTADSDFGRFPRLKWRNPLRSAVRAT